MTTSIPASAVAPYRAPAWLPGGHLQTIYASLFISAPQVDYRRERLELADGDFLDFDWIGDAADAPVVVLFHGLEGSSASHYAHDLMHNACRAPISPATAQKSNASCGMSKAASPTRPCMPSASRSAATRS
jgi:predicted alpha/beta-fold hydrolase